MARDYKLETAAFHQEATLRVYALKTLQGILLTWQAPDDVVLKEARRAMAAVLDAKTRIAKENAERSPAA